MIGTTANFALEIRTDVVLLNGKTALCVESLWDELVSTFGTSWNGTGGHRCNVRIAYLLGNGRGRDVYGPFHLLQQTKAGHSV